MMTLAEVDSTMADPENKNRAAILAYESGDEYVAEWGGTEVRAGNPFGLDSRLTSIGAPIPHNLFLVSRDDYTQRMGN